METIFSLWALTGIWGHWAPKGLMTYLVTFTLVGCSNRDHIWIQASLFPIWFLVFFCGEWFPGGCAALHKPHILLLWNPNWCYIENSILRLLKEYWTKHAQLVSINYGFFLFMESKEAGTPGQKSSGHSPRLFFSDLSRKSWTRWWALTHSLPSRHAHPASRKCQQTVFLQLEEIPFNH